MCILQRIKGVASDRAVFVEFCRGAKCTGFSSGMRPVHANLAKSDIYLYYSFATRTPLSFLSECSVRGPPHSMVSSKKPLHLLSLFSDRSY